MKIFTRFFPFILFLFYLYHAPTTVQDGDSGELVTNAFIFGVPHPPGFPLFIWIYGIFELIFPFGTVYFKASLLTIFFSISSIFLLNKISEDRNKFITIGILLTFATSRIFWRYSIIPDAYMLNSFLIICISYIYFKKIPNYKNAGIINLLFFLGLTNHQTIILLLPIVLYYSYKSVNFKKIPFVFILPVPIFILLYFSLFLMNDKEPITWNYIRSIPDLIHHITRADYGRFVLVANKPREHYFEVIVFFGKTIFNDFGILFLSIPFVFLFLKRNYKNISVRTYLYASILIFHLAVVMQGFNIEPYKEHTETLSKHFLLPILLLIILASRFPWSNYINPKWKAGILFFPIILGNFTNYYELNNYRKNTIIEDYSRNLLLSVEEKNSVLIVTGDSIWFSLAYLQTVEKINPNIAILKPNMLSGKWVLQKINDKHPNLNLTYEDVSNGIYLKLESIQKLLQRGFKVYITSLYFQPTLKVNFKVIVRGLVHELQEGKGIIYENDTPNTYRFRSHPEELFKENEKYNTYINLFHDYSLHNFFQGVEFFAKGNLIQAKGKFEECLSNDSSFSPALYNLCEIHRRLGTMGQEKRCKNQIENPMDSLYFQVGTWNPINYN